MNLWLAGNAQCLSCINFEPLQTLKPGVPPRNCHVISFLMTKRAQKTSKNENSFYECATIVTLKCIYCDIYPASIWTVEHKIERLFEKCREIKKFTKKSGIYLQKSSNLARIQRNLFDITGKFWFTTRFSLCEMVYISTNFLQNKIWFARRKCLFAYSHIRKCELFGNVTPLHDKAAEPL